MSADFVSVNKHCTFDFNLLQWMNILITLAYVCYFCIDWMRYFFIQKYIYIVFLYIVAVIARRIFVPTL